MRISLVFILIGLFTLCVLNARSVSITNDLAVHYRIEVEVNPGVDAEIARQAFLMKPEIQIISWDSQSGILDLRTVAQITPDMLKSWLAGFQLKVKTIQTLRN
jgi:hypothetical protein